MSEDFQELTGKALQLPPDERVVLAETLLLTIDEAHDRIVDQAIITELERRLADFKDGRVKGVPAAQVLKNVREALATKS